ncbi:unnamed protein product, partial [Prunus brigantina]
SRCTSIAWVPKGNGVFVAAHADGNLYVYEKASLNLPLFFSKCYFLLVWLRINYCFGDCSGDFGSNSAM